MTIQTIVLKAHQSMHLGVGRGSGFSTATYNYVPASTLRGAFCAAWWRDQANADQARFDELIAGVSFTDAVAVGTGRRFAVTGLGMDRRECRLGHHPADGFGPETTVCDTCHRPTVFSRGRRGLPPGVAIRAHTRVALDEFEQAREDRLFERQSLQANGTHLVALVAGNTGDLVKEGAAIRVGAAKSVSGRLEVLDLTPRPVEPLTLRAGPNLVRLEMLTAGVFVDDFGCPTMRPSSLDVRHSLKLSESVTVEVTEVFARWTMVSGWHSQANRPKPEDPGVLAHSCYYLTVTSATPTTVPSLVSDLGLRTTEGCGWATVRSLPPGKEAHDA